MSGDRKRASERRLEQLRALRSEHFIERSRPAPPAESERPSVRPAAGSVPPPPQQSRPPIPESTAVDAAQMKYEMELADHRQTMALLLAEKDETIRTLRELVDELRRQLAAPDGSPDAAAPAPERAAAPLREPRPLFDFTTD